MDNIDLYAYRRSSFNIVGQWVTLGSAYYRTFSGVFDGNDRKISNFNYISPGRYGVGLFGYVKGRIDNLGLINPNIVA